MGGLPTALPGAPPPPRYLGRAMPAPPPPHAPTPGRSPGLEPLNPRHPGDYRWWAVVVLVAPRSPPPTHIAPPPPPTAGRATPPPATTFPDLGWSPFPTGPVGLLPHAARACALGLLHSPGGWLPQHAAQFAFGYSPATAAASCQTIIVSWWPSSPVTQEAGRDNVVVPEICLFARQWLGAVLFSLAVRRVGGVSFW